MKTEIKPSPTPDVNPAEKPGTPDITPIGPLTIMPELPPVS